MRTTPKQMSTHFKWYPASEETVVPWNARYSFPSQANKALKTTPRIPPKNGSVFAPGNVIRLEFPAQGYVNPLNTTISFDLTLYGFTTASTEIVRIQNSIHSVFNRIRFLYGSTPLEDMINYNIPTRALSEWTATNQHQCMDQTSISEGIGGISLDVDSGGLFGNVNIRNKYIQGISKVITSSPAAFSEGASLGSVPQQTDTPAGVTGNGSVGITRRYQINLNLGLLNQDKLLPTKFMASQLAIELTLEQAAACIFVSPDSVGTVTGTPTYAIGNVNLIPEILNFDASYDQMFLEGLRSGGVPIKFSTWKTYVYSSASTSTLNLLVPERSRSVKSVFCVQRRQQPTFYTDSGALLFDTSALGTSTLQDFQFRVGGRYFPAAPVQCSSNVGSAISNGGAEAFVELQKALNVVGDYRLSTNVNASRWALQNAGGTLQEYDYMSSLTSVAANGVPSVVITETATNAFSGTLGSQCFAMATDFETSNGVEISGLNAEEQSDINVIVHYTSPQVTGASLTIGNVSVTGGTPSAFEVYCFVDAMIVLHENNVLELIM